MPEQCEFCGFATWCPCRSQKAADKCKRSGAHCGVSDEARKTCDHSSYRGMAKDGRCCPTCGTFMVDFGD
jgi:hypothetical protein